MPETRWLSDEELRAWRAYVETQGDLIAALDADLAPAGVTLGEYQVLVFLSEAPDRRMRMSDLAEMLQLSPSGLTRRLDGLVRRGLVGRQGSPDDRRVMLAVLTAEGRRCLQATAPTHVASVRQHLIDVLDDDELAMLERIFTKVRARLDA